MARPPKGTQKKSLGRRARILARIVSVARACGRFRVSLKVGSQLCVPEHSNIEAILTPHSWSTTQLSSATKEVCAVACENGLYMYRTARMSLMSGARPCCWLRCSDRARHIYRFQFPEPTPLRRRRCEKWGSVRVQGLLSASDLSSCLGPSKPGVLGGGAKARHRRLASRTLTATAIQGNAQPSLERRDGGPGKPGSEFRRPRDH